MVTSVTGSETGPCCPCHLRRTVRMQHPPELSREGLAEGAKGALPSPCIFWVPEFAPLPVAPCPDSPHGPGRMAECGEKSGCSRTVVVPSMKREAEGAEEGLITSFAEEPGQCLCRSQERGKRGPPGRFLTVRAGSSLLKDPLNSTLSFGVEQICTGAPYMRPPESLSMRTLPVGCPLFGPLPPSSSFSAPDFALL